MNKNKTTPKSPTVSIVMATFNDSKYIQECLEGVFQQTYTDWEFLIIDDASTDNTSDIISKYSRKDTRIRYIQNKKNLGLTPNLNKGVNLAKGKFIARLDSDDVWINKNKLKMQVDFLTKNREYGMVGCYANSISTDGAKLFELIYPQEDSDIRQKIMRHGCFIHSCVVIRRDLLLKAGSYDTQYTYSQDYDMYLKMGTVGKFHNIPKFMVNYRINPKGLSLTKYPIQMKEVLKIISKYKSYYPNYYLGYTMWSLRRYYPLWFRGALARNIKRVLLRSN